MSSPPNIADGSRECSCHQCLSARHSTLVFGGYASGAPAAGCDGGDTVLLKRPAGVYTGQHRANTIASMGRSVRRAMARMQLAERAQRADVWSRFEMEQAADGVRAARPPLRSSVVAATSDGAARA